MRWELSWGDKLDFLKKLEQDNGFTPKALLDRPRLRPEYRQYLEAFYEVNAGRSIGESIQPLATADITAYAAFFGITGLDERGRFYDRMRTLDKVYMEVMNKKLEALPKS